MAVGEFPAMPKSRDGLSSWCRPCHREAARASSRRRSSDTRAARAAAAAANRQRREVSAQVQRWERAARRVYYGNCETCGIGYVSSRPDRRACSTKCWQRRHRVRQPSAIRVCAQCNFMYVGTPQRRFCSPGCGAKYHFQADRDRRRAVGLGRPAETIFRLTIFERDRWRCGICRDPVDRDRKHPDPLSASLDHVIPLARGGTHSDGNVQLAHLACNIAKGARVAA